MSPPRRSRSRSHRRKRLVHPRRGAKKVKGEDFDAFALGRAVSRRLSLGLAWPAWPWIHPRAARFSCAPARPPLWSADDADSRATAPCRDACPAPAAARPGDRAAGRPCPASAAAGVPPVPAGAADAAPSVHRFPSRAHRPPPAGSAASGLSVPPGPLRHGPARSRHAAV